MPLNFFFRIGPVVSEIRVGEGARNSPPPSEARYKNTPVGRGLTMTSWIRDVTCAND